jgi:transposase
MGKIITGLNRIPDYIKKVVIPEGTRIVTRYNGTRFYVYTYGTEKDTTVGSIKSTNGVWTFVSNKTHEMSHSILEKEYGAYKFLQKHTQNIFEDLKLYFTDLMDACFIYCFCALNVIYTDIRVKSVKRYFDKSYMSSEWSGVYFSPNSVSERLKRIADNDVSRLNYMKNRVIDQTHDYYTDGTLITNYCEDNLLAEKGRGDKNDQPVINVIYLYDATKRIPVFYKAFKGNVVDGDAVYGLIEESGLANVLLIADKGFINKDLITYYDSKNINYIIPVKQNDSIIDNLFNFVYDNEFEFNGTVYSGRKLKVDETDVDGNKMIHYLYCIQDQSRCQQKKVNYYQKIAEDELTELIENARFLKEYEAKLLKAKKDKTIKVDEIVCEKYERTYTLETLKQDEKYFGVVFLYSKLNITCKEIVPKYIHRWVIESMNSIYHSNFKACSLYVHDYDSIKTMMFLKHVSLEMYYTLMNYINDNEVLAKKFTVNELIEELKDVRIIKYGNDLFTTNVTEKKRLFFESLGVPCILPKQYRKKPKIEKEKKKRGRKPKVKDSTPKEPQKRGRKLGSKNKPKI